MLESLRSEAKMGQSKVEPTSQTLRRRKKITNKQREGPAADLENIGEALTAEVSRLQRRERELELQVQEQTAELAKARETLLAEITERTQAEKELKQSREELRAFATRLQAEREEERACLAREIHDELSGSLTALKMDLSLLQDRAAKDRKAFLEKLSSMSGLIDNTLARVHTIVTELRPIILDKLGLIAAIDWQAREFQERSGIACETRLPAEDIPLDSERATAVFRIFQEALTNVARHAEASKVAVDLRRKRKSLILAVRDNGRGIDEHKISDHQSIGLIGMRERALSFGGAVRISRLPRGGTLVGVKVPIE
jgi:signal transduction histidine kinase